VAALAASVAVAAWLVRKSVAPEPAASARPSASPSSSAQPPPLLDAGAPQIASSAEPYVELDGGTMVEQKAALLANMTRVHRLEPGQRTAIEKLFAGSNWLGQGNPKVTVHPMTRAECRSIRAESKKPIASGDERCGLPYMVPLYDPSANERAEQAKVCIDQYEFPNIPCEYPVTYARADEAKALCEAMDKRLCDAHEWEGACAGALKPADSEYTWGERRLQQEYLHNKDREIVWAYGKEKDHSKCATASKKSPKCFASGWECGSNTYPAGAFPECVSSLGVYDQHGNAAEHMNLPLVPEELASRGGSGDTEMKGSWFIFAKGEAHEDDCRWRALAWHRTKVMDPESHRNYHLGFRCCRDLK
jgi:formylglycine-generating enzyme